MMKKMLTFCGLVTLLVSNVHAINRCLELIDKRVSQEHLNLVHCELSKKDMPMLLSYLSAHPHIKSLDLSDNEIGSAVGDFAQNTTLVSLNVSKNKLRPEDVIGFVNNNTLTSLDISDNKCHFQKTCLILRSPV